MRRYVREHNIGAPALRERIEQADDLQRELTLSTLQRFMNDKHRTTDLYVSMFAAFLRKMDVPIEADEFGEVLASFYSLPQVRDDEPETLTVGGMAGVYKTHTSSPETQSPLPLRARDAAGSSRVSLRAIPGQSFLLAQEDCDASSLQGDRRRFAYDGVALVRGSELHIVLRSGLTRRPKFYSIAPRTSGPAADSFILEGEGFEYPPQGGARSHCKAQFVAQLEGPGA